MKNLLFLILVTFCGCAATQNYKKETNMDDKIKIALQQQWFFNGRGYEGLNQFSPKFEEMGKEYAFHTKETMYKLLQEEKIDFSGLTEYVQEHDRFEMTLKGDGSCEIKFERYVPLFEDGHREEGFSTIGKWEMDGNTLILHYYYPEEGYLVGEMTLYNPKKLPITYKAYFRFENDYLILSPFEIKKGNDKK